MESFAVKLDYTLSLLSISRGRLSAELGIDKSVVSRWLSGVRIPNSNNLAVITAKIADYAPGFSMLDWSLTTVEIGARLRAARDGGTEAAPPQTLASFQDWLALPKLRAAAADSGDAGRAAEGFWRSIAPMPGMPGHFGQSFSRFATHDDGTIRIETGFFTLRRLGWSVCVGNQFFGCVTGTTDGYFAFTVFNRVPGPRLEMMDGIFLGALADNGGMPLAMPVVMDRIEELSGDDDRDEARLMELLMTPPVLAAEAVPAATLERLSAAAPDAGSPLLVMSALASLARGPVRA